MPKHIGEQTGDDTAERVSGPLPASVSASTSLLIACGCAEARVRAISPPIDQPLHPYTLLPVVLTMSHVVVQARHTPGTRLQGQAKAGKGAHSRSGGVYWPPAEVYSSSRKSTVESARHASSLASKATICLPLHVAPQAPAKGAIV